MEGEETIEYLVIFYVYIKEQVDCQFTHINIELKVLTDMLLLIS